jgi:hypothetical protein
MKKIISVFALAILLSPLGLNAQKGCIKIYSEIKGIEVYLDEVRQGVDVITLDSISAGSHYLKVNKDNGTIYSELVTVNANTVTTVLVKNSREVEQKILATKYPQEEQYKARKVDVLINTQYVTETTGKTNSYYWPGYFSMIGTSNSSAQSVTYATKDWFFATESGRVKLSEYNFAKMSGNQDLVDRIDKATKKAKRQSNIMGGIGATMLFGGMIVGGIGVGDLASKNKFLSTDAAAGCVAGGIVGFLVGAGVVGAAGASLKSLNQHWMTIEEAIAQARQYNQRLKKELGLPDNYEPASDH